jgi:hypothetical protein
MDMCVVCKNSFVCCMQELICVLYARTHFIYLSLCFSEGKFSPKYVNRASVLTCDDHQWKGLAPVCPQCHMLFHSVGECAQHCTVRVRLYIYIF